MKHRADLYPPLGKPSGPCKVVDRIYQRVRSTAEQQDLVNTVEGNRDLSKAQAITVYKEFDKNPAASPFRQFGISPHAQYRMDLRGISVAQVQGLAAKLAQWYLNPKNVRWLETLRDTNNIQLNYDATTGTTKIDDEPVRPGYERRGKLVRVSHDGISVVFAFGQGTVDVVTAYPQVQGDIKAPAGGCPKPAKTAKGYQAPAGELSGVRTYPSEKPSKGIDTPSGTTIHHSPGESPRSDRDRAAPMRPGQRDELLQKTPANAVFNTPGPSEPGQKIHVRSPGTRGEDYGHPFKTDVTPRRTEAALYPSYSERQRDQKSKAKLYYKRYYQRHRGKIRARAKRDYLHKKFSPTFKKQRKFRNSQQYGWRFNRLPSGGYRSPADRSRDYRKSKKATVAIPFYHPNYGAGVVLDVRDQDVLIEQTDSMGGESLGTGTVPFFTFLRGVEFDDESGIDALFDLADADFDRDDEDDGESQRLATFYRETFRPGDNLDPGDGVRDLGEPSPVSPTLPYPDTDRNYRKPGEVMNNISPTDNNPGSAKVIPEGHDFENRKASAVRVAAKMAEILQGMDPGIRSRARGVTPKVKRRDVDNVVYSFAVPGSKGETYTVKVKGVPSGNVRTISKMDLKLSCTCDFWQWQGPEHWAKAGDYLFGKPRGAASRPTEKDPDGRNRLCKHAVAVLDLIGRWPAAGKR
jgi:hypothetical protein